MTAAADSDERTRIAELHQRAALAGVFLHPLPGNRWIVSRWSLSRELSTLDEAEAFIDEMVPGQKC